MFHFINFCFAEFSYFKLFLAGTSTIVSSLRKPRDTRFASKAWPRPGLCYQQDLGDPGGGDPWFPHGTLLLHSLAGMAWWSGLFFWFVCCFAIPTEMIQSYHLLP